MMVQTFELPGNTAPNSSRKQVEFMDIDPDTGKKIVVCEKVNKNELTEAEQVDTRTFYWAAFNGFDKYVRYMVVNLKWSPFIKSFRNRTIVSGAIWGSRIETIRMLLGEY